MWVSMTSSCLNIVTNSEGILITKCRTQLYLRHASINPVGKVLILKDSHLIHHTVLHTASLGMKEVVSLHGHRQSQHWAPTIYAATISLQQDMAGNYIA